MKRMQNQSEGVPPQVSIVVPAYHSEQYIDKLWSRIKIVMESLNEDFEMRRKKQ